MTQAEADSAEEAAMRVVAAGSGKRMHTSPEGSRVDEALNELARGRPVVVGDGESGGELVCAAEFATPALVAFLVRYTSGYLCVALPEADADRLGLPPMVSGEPYAVTVDARCGTGTGISAHDRSRTARLLADPSTVADDLTRPGHIVPMRARRAGVLDYAGHAEAAVDLVRLAGLRVAGLTGAIISERHPAVMAGRAELAEFAAKHDLCVVEIQDLVRCLRSRRIERVAQTSVRLCGMRFRAERYRDTDGLEHVALTLGQLDAVRDPLVRVHAECLAGDVFGSLDCECGVRLRKSLEMIAAQGRGMLVYVRAGVEDGAAVTARILDEHGLEAAVSPPSGSFPTHLRHGRTERQRSASTGCPRC